MTLHVNGGLIFSGAPEKSPISHIPNVMSIITAVGSFHLSAHIPECFVKFSLHFMLGSGKLMVNTGNPWQASIQFLPVLEP